MVCARSFIIAALCSATILMLAAPARAQSVDFIDGIGLVDYRQEPKLEIGSWVKYHITSKSEGGSEDDYFVTLLVAGEERFWGEDCFWIETWTNSGGGEQPLASLISYDLFNDPERYAYAQYYSRKSISDISDAGGRAPTINKFPIKALQSRNVLRPTWSFDTLGTERVENEVGSFNCTKYQVLRQGESVRRRADSTSTTQVSDRRIDYWSSKVPITGLVRQDIRLEVNRFYVRNGESEDRGRRLSDTSIGSAELVEFGKGKMPKLVDERFQKSIKAQEREKRR